MRTLAFAAAAAALSFVGAAALAQPGGPVQGSASHGQAVFEAQCALCHGLGGGEGGQGPDLNGVIGRPVAGAKGYPYTDALKAKGGTSWTAESLDTFLKDPQAVAAGTAMPVSVDSAADRADLIAFLATTK